jgi:hypothetical protein
MWAATVARAREIGAGLGHAEVALDVGIYRADEVQRARARADGFAIGTTFHRLRIEASASHDWAQLRVVYVDNQPVAMLHGNDRFAGTRAVATSPASQSSRPPGAEA